VLDVELLFDNEHAVIQHLGWGECDFAELVQRLSQQYQLEARMENLALPPVAEAEAGGCGKPDCGKTSGGGCTSCASGGCSSCGDHKVDLRPYFAHLREQMEQSQRVPLA